jgi:hypothetical protein
MFTPTQGESNFINEFYCDGVEISNEMYMDASMARDWLKVAQDEDADVVLVLSKGLCELSEKQHARAATLLTRALDDISADNLIELRDLLRSAMFDAMRQDIVTTAKYVENDYEQKLSPSDYARDHGVHLQGDPLTGTL